MEIHINKNVLQNNMKDKKLIAIALISIGVIGRIWMRWVLPQAPHFYITLNGISQPVFMIDMFFLIAIISIAAGRYIGNKYAFLIPTTIMAITDIYFGNNWILLFTWSGFAMMTLIGYKTRERNFSTYIGFGLLSVLAYDAWTNFGTWVGWYPHTLHGLILCFTLAIPFTLWHIVSMSIALPLASLPLEHAKIHEIENKNIAAIE